MLPHLRSYVLPVTLALASLSSLAQAQEYKAGSLTITHPWVRATPGGAQVGGGFLTITNTGSAPDRLLGSTLSGADRVEVHVTSNEGGISRMRPVEGGVEIKPGETVTLAPGSYHLMLMGLKGPYIDGEQVKGTLLFERAGTVPVEFEVRPVGAKAPTEHMPKH
jgi:copper(I)-binding protein